jgi:excisionase family DNA binding protein
MAKMIEPPLLADELEVPEATLAQWRYKGTGPAYVKVGRHVRYRREDVDTWLAEHTTRPGGGADAS